MTKTVRLIEAMSDRPSPTPEQKSPLVTGAWAFAIFAAVCSIAAAHTMFGGIFPFVALAAAIAMGASIANTLSLPTR